MVKFIPLFGHDHLMNDLAEIIRSRIDIHDGQAIGLRKIRTEHQSKSQRLGRSLHCQFGGWVKGWVRSLIHNVLP